MRLERVVPCDYPPRPRRVGDSFAILPGLVLALSFAIGSVIAGLHG